MGKAVLGFFVAVAATIVAARLTFVRSSPSGCRWNACDSSVIM